MRRATSYLTFSLPQKHKVRLRGLKANPTSPPPCKGGSRGAVPYLMCLECPKGHFVPLWQCNVRQETARQIRRQPGLNRLADAAAALRADRKEDTLLCTKIGRSRVTCPCESAPSFVRRGFFAPPFGNGEAGRVNGYIGQRRQRCPMRCAQVYGAPTVS